MTKLLTIADLDQPQAVIAPLIERAQSLSQLYYDFITNDSESSTFGVYIGGDEERAPGIHASEISNCFRQIVYSVMNTPRKNTDSATNMKMRFRMGHAVHGMLQADFKRIALRSDGLISFEAEAEISPELQDVAEVWGLHSHCDGIFTLFDENGDPQIRIGLEIKTKSGPQFEKLKKPDTDHMEQTCVYMAALDLPLMWILYYNKSNSNITTSFAPYLFRFNRGLWERLEFRFVKANHLADKKQLPEREEGMHCSWCAFSHTCNPEYMKRKKRSKTTRPQVSAGMLTTGRK